MRKKFFARIVATILSLLFISSAVLPLVAAEPMLTTSSASDSEDYVKETLEILSDAKWIDYRDSHASTPFYSGSPITVRAVDFIEHKAGSNESGEYEFGKLDELDGKKDVQARRA